MAEYVPLTSNSLAEHDDDDEHEPLKIGGKLSHQPNSLHVEYRTTFMWLAILMAITAISVAAGLHISILLVSRLEPMRNSDDVASTLRIGQLDTNLQKGRAIMKQRGSKSE